MDVKEYIYDDTVDTSEKSVVVDWYYKVKTPSGRTALHYVKFVGSTLLYASENDPEYRERGFTTTGCTLLCWMSCTLRRARLSASAMWRSVKTHSFILTSSAPTFWKTR